MRFALIIITSLFLLKNAAGQDSVRVTRVYENNKPKTALDSFYYQSRNTIFVSLEDGFKDSIFVTVNGIPWFNKYIETNESIGLADEFGIPFKDSTEKLVMRIKFVKGNFYIQEMVNLKYKSLRIGHWERGWELLYGNRFWVRE